MVSMLWIYSFFSHPYQMRKSATRSTANTGSTQLQQHTHVVGQVVADERDREPVDARAVCAGAELNYQHQQTAHQNGDTSQPESGLFGEQICCGLSHCGAENLDDPEVDRDLRDLVPNKPGCRRRRHAGVRRTTPCAMNPVS